MLEYGGEWKREGGRQRRGRERSWEMEMNRVNEA